MSYSRSRWELVDAEFVDAAHPSSTISCMSATCCAHARGMWVMDVEGVSKRSSSGMEATKAVGAGPERSSTVCTNGGGG